MITFTLLLITLIKTIISFECINVFGLSQKLTFTTIKKYNEFSTKIKPEEIGYLTDIEHVPTIIQFKFADNKNQIIQTEQFANSNLTHLVQKLILSSNNIQFAENGSFAQLMCLKYLDLSKNNISILTSAIFQDLSYNLEFLDLSRNHIKNLPSNVFKNIPRLRKLNLASNEITILNTTSLLGLPNLDFLNLKWNQIKHIDNAALSKCPNLHELHLEYNHLGLYTQLYGRIFDGLTNLQILNVAFNNLITFNYKQYSDLKKLTTLFLDGNYLFHLNGTSLRATLPKLHIIGINENFWNCSHLEIIVNDLKTNHINFTRWIENNETDNIDGIKCNDTFSLSTIFKHDIIKLFKLNHFIAYNDKELINKLNITDVKAEDDFRSESANYNSKAFAKEETHLNRNEAILMSIKNVRFLAIVLIVLITAFVMINVLARINVQNSSFIARVSTTANFRNLIRFRNESVSLLDY